jgi:hypothetical protein
MTLRDLTLPAFLAFAPVLLVGQGQTPAQPSQPQKPQPAAEKAQGPAQKPSSPATKPQTPQAAAAGRGSGGLDPADLEKPLADEWPSYSGDYTGRRYSALTQIDKSNVKGLTLAWVARVNPGSPNPAGGGGGFGGRGGGAGVAPVIVGGEGTGEFSGGGNATVKGAA